MSLTVGDKLGVYEIIGLIGAGGMGEVYRARDSRLGREVAIKVSQERFSERFEREARAISSLNHPNICTLYDVGPNYLVMEYVEGESPKGPLPFDDALRIAKQIAEALSEAHEKNVVHRDLKPANVKIKPDGTVKVLDFGLAKMASASAGDPENSPTMSMAATQAGVILGTAGYMPPEQARGKPTDKRADIWSFGIVFHELLTGRRLFQGEDVTDTLAKVIQAEPSWEGVPPKVLRLLKKCLEKDPKKRLRDIGDVWELLEAPPVRARAGSPGAWIAAGLLAVVAAIALWAPWRVEKVLDRPLVRLDVNLGENITLLPPGNAGSAVILSPDGTRLVYAASIASGPVKLFTRKLDQPKATELPGTDGADGPFFSPDGQWVAFGVGNKLNKISVDGGAVVPLGDVTPFGGGSWAADGSVVAAQLLKQLVRISPGAASPAPITEMASGEFIHLSPQILPGDKAALFAVYATPPDPEKASIDVVSFADRKRKTLVRGGVSPHYAASSQGWGHLLYINKGTLFAIPFDPDRLETHGAAVPVVDGVATAVQESGGGQYNLSQTGTLVYRKGTGGSASGTSAVQWLDVNGKSQPLVTKAAVYQAPRLSPDGKRLAVVIRESGTQDVWVYEIQRETWTKLNSGGTNISPIWSPDGKYIAFGSIANGMMWTRSDGAGQPQPLTQSKNIQVPSSFTPDGKRLAYIDVSNLSGGGAQIWTLQLEGEGGQLKGGTAEPFLKTQFNDVNPAFSPDGHWLAYSSNESGRPEVYVRPFPIPSAGQGGKWTISSNGGTYPVWSQSGHELLYQSGTQIMAVSYSVKGDAFQQEKARVWTAKLGGLGWDLAPDGKRLAVVTPAEAPEAPKADHEVVFLQNFFDELRRKAPLPK